MKCPRCGEDNNEVKQTYSDRNYLMSSNLRTRRCNDCGWLFDTKESVSGEPYKFVDKQRIKSNQKDIFGGKK
jgi:transcriptional regulator NrdR family protein